MINIQNNAVIGIDLGTYNSAATVNLGDETAMLRPREGQTDQGICFPSFVEFSESGELLRVGEFARRSLPVNPERVVWGVKRLIGKSYSEVKASGDLNRFQYKILEGRDGSCRIQVGKTEYSPTEISSMILRKIKTDAEADFNPIGNIVSEATITVPAYFSPFQRSETEVAAKMAGFEKVHLIPEPTAAALAYKVNAESKNQYIAVIDLGAGTLDVTIAMLYLDEQNLLQTSEKGHSGHTALGGLDIDDAILNAVVRTHRLRDVMKDSHGQARLRAEIERAKIELSESYKACIKFNYGKGVVDLVLTREEIESAVQPVIEQCRGPIRIALNEAGLRPADLAHVLLVGGPMKMPAMRQLIQEELSENTRLVSEVESIDLRGFPVNPMEAVARGAVMGSFGAITPHAYGVLVDSAYFELIPRRTRYPCENSTYHLASDRRRSMAINVIQKALDPKTNQEVYIMLGIFQFDYHPEPGESRIQVNAEYTENGILNLTVVQPSTMVRLPLYNLSRLEGRKISKPSTPLPIQPPTYNTPPPATRGGLGGPMMPPPSVVWSQQELEEAIRTSNRLLPIVRARIGRASSEDRAHLELVTNELTQTIANRGGQDLNTITPQLRNLNRALLMALYSSRLIEQQELEQFQRNIV